MAVRACAACTLFPEFYYVLLCFPVRPGTDQGQHACCTYDAILACHAAGTFTSDAAPVENLHLTGCHVVPVYKLMTRCIGPDGLRQSLPALRIICILSLSSHCAWLFTSYSSNCISCLADVYAITMFGIDPVFPQSESGPDADRYCPPSAREC